MKFFKKGEWYVKTEPQLQSRRHQIVEAVKLESYGTLLVRYRFIARVLGYWDPQEDTYDFENINQFEMTLPDFDKKKWSRIPDIDKNRIVMEKFGK